MTWVIDVLALSVDVNDVLDAITRTVFLDLLSQKQSLPAPTLRVFGDRSVNTRSVREAR